MITLLRGDILYTKSTLVLTGKKVELIAEATPYTIFREHVCM